MRYIFELSKENLKLSKIELKALFEIYNIKVTSKTKGNLIYVKCSANEQLILKLCKRSTQIKWCSLISKGFSWIKSPFCVRVQRGKKSEQKIASEIWYKIKNPKVNLENPKTTIYVIDNLLTKLIWKREKSEYKEREPSKKPVFHPTGLKPKLARLIINLSRCKEGGTLLDPFCGRGSILIEASLIGCKAIGSELDEKVLRGARINLMYYKQKAKLKLANALELEKHFKNIDAIATDPPYGRSSHIGAENIQELYEGFLKSAKKVLRKNKYLVLIHPHYLKFKIPKSYKVTDKADIYVHGGLTRKILVLKT